MNFDEISCFEQTNGWLNAEVVAKRIGGDAPFFGRLARESRETSRERQREAAVVERLCRGRKGVPCPNFRSSRRVSVERDADTRDKPATIQCFGQ